MVAVKTQSGQAERLILLHGSWGGGWIWEPILPHLADFDILTPTLSGGADSGTMLDESIGLERHVEDVVGLLDRERVILVGHSYGGLVATLAACRRPDRIGKLVVLDGFLARQGRSVFDLHPEIRGLMEGFRLPQTPWRIAAAPASMLGIPAGASAAWYDQRTSPISAATHEDVVADGLGSLAKISRHYIRCTGFPIFEATERSAAEGGWRCSRIDTGHMAMVTAPADLAMKLRTIIAH